MNIICSFCAYTWLYSLKDVIIEPYRSKLIPHFNDVQQLALKNGALGAGISGSGPSIFSVCKGDNVATKVNEALSAFYETTGIEFNSYVCMVNVHGVKVKVIV